MTDIEVRGQEYLPVGLLSTYLIILNPVSPVAFGVVVGSRRRTLVDSAPCVCTLAAIAANPERAAHPSGLVALPWAGP